MYNLNQNEMYRYARHFSIKEIGLKGQQKLKNASVLIIGAGGIGCPASLYAASCGIGVIGIVDYDKIELSNLQRQILYQDKQCGELKVDVAAKTLGSLNSNVQIKTYNKKLTAQNAKKILTGYDIVIDGSDNYPTRYLVNDICAYLKKPLISASIYKFTGQISTFCSEAAPCYRCVFPSPPAKEVIPGCAEAGVLGVIPGIMGTLAINEAIKLILQIGDSLVGKLTIFEGLSCKLLTYDIKKSANCPICSQHKKFEALQRYEIKPAANNLKTITSAELNQLLEKNKSINLIDVREEWERNINKIPNSKHIPLHLIHQKKFGMPKDAMTVVYCKKGARSMKAQTILQANGYKNVYSLAGGVDAWFDFNHSNVTRY